MAGLWEVHGHAIPLLSYREVPRATPLSGNAPSWRLPWKSFVSSGAAADRHRNWRRATSSASRPKKPGEDGAGNAALPAPAECPSDAGAAVPTCFQAVTDAAKGLKMAACFGRRSTKPVRWRERKRNVTHNASGSVTLVN